MGERLSSPNSVEAARALLSETDDEDDDDSEMMGEMGLNLEARNTSLDQLEAMFGDRVFRYKMFSGTVREMATSCPAFDHELGDGPIPAAAWLEANDQPEEIVEVEAEDIEENTIEDEPTEDNIIEEAEDEPEESVSPHDDMKVTSPSIEKNTKEIIVKERDADSDSIVLTDNLALNNEFTEQKIVQNPVTENEPDPTNREIRANTMVEPVVIHKDVDKKINVTELPIAEMRAEIGVAANEPKLSEEILNIPIAAPTEKIKQTQPSPELIEKVAEADEWIPTVEQLEPDEFIETVSSEIITESFHVPDIEIVETYPEQSSSVVEDSQLEFESVGEDESAEESDISMVSLETDIFEIDENAYTDVETGEPDEIGVVAVELEAEEPVEADTFVSLQAVLEREQSDDTEIDPERAVEIEKAKVETHKAVTDAVSELVGELPEHEVIKYQSDVIQDRVAAIVKNIKILEKSKNEQECREALVGLRKELADLLTLLGYEDVDARVTEIMRRNHDMSELKRIIASLLQAAIADETVTDSLAVSSRPHNKFGKWIVGRTTTVLQVA